MIPFDVLVGVALASLLVAAVLCDPEARRRASDALCRAWP